MPVAVPAAMLAGSAISAIGAHKAQTAQQKADQAKVSGIQSILDQNFAANQAWRDQNLGNFGNLASMALAPQTQTSSNWSNGTSDVTQSVDFGPEGNALRGQAVAATQNLPFQAQQLAGQNVDVANQQISAAQRAANTDIANAAAKRGVDPGLMRLGAMPQFAQQRSQAQVAANNALYGEQAAQPQRLASMLQYYQRNRTQGQQSQRGGGTTTGPANYSAALGAYGAMAPVNREIATT